MNIKHIIIGIIGCWGLLSLLMCNTSYATTVSYTYDIMGRLTQADYGNGMVVQYAYDTMGNRTSQTAPPRPPGPPIVTTQAPTVMVFGVPPTVYATLEGTVNANRASTTVTFEYGLTTAYGSSVTATPSPVTGIKATVVSNDTITGLAPSTTYHHRVKGVNSAGTSYGNDIAFTTPSGIAPAVTASPAGGAYSGPVTVTLSAADALVIFYSTDGSPPSQIYSDPLNIAVTTTLKFYAFTNSGMSEIMTETYTFGNSVLPVMIDGATPRYFASIQGAFDAAGSGAVIKARAFTFTESPTLNQAKKITIKGGYAADFTTASGTTVLKGVLTIRLGSLIVEKLQIR